MTILESFIMSMFDITGYIIVSNSLLRGDFKNIKKLLIRILIYSLITALLGAIISKEYITFFTLSFSLIITYQIYKKRFWVTLKIWLIAIIILLIIQLISLIPLRIIVEDIKYDFFNGFIAQTIFIFLTILISFKLQLYVILEFVEKANKIFTYLIINIFIVLISILTYWKLDINNVLEKFITFSALSLSMIFINFVILRNGLRNEYESRQLQLYDKYIPVIDNLISEVRKKQHEFDNHIQALNMIVYANDNKEDIVNNIKKYTDDLNDTNELGDLIKLNNKVLAGFLYSKQKRAEENEIRFNIKITNYDINTKLKDFEIVELIGNLINNAFETGIKDNIVELIISRENSSSIVEVHNKHPHVKQSDIKNFFRKEFSTKAKKNRGYGLYNVKEVLDKYNITIEVSNKEREEYNSNFLVFRIIFS